MNDQMIGTMNDARHEIQALRRRNEILAAKVEVFDSMMCLLHTQPAERKQGASPDVVFALEKRIVELEKEQEEARLPRAAMPAPEHRTSLGAQ